MKILRRMAEYWPAIILLVFAACSIYGSALYLNSIGPAYRIAVSIIIFLTVTVIFTQWKNLRTYGLLNQEIDFIFLIATIVAIFVNIISILGCIAYLAIVNHGFGSIYTKPLTDIFGSISLILTVLFFLPITLIHLIGEKKEIEETDFDLGF